MQVSHKNISQSPQVLGAAHTWKPGPDLTLPFPHKCDPPQESAISEHGGSIF